VPSQRERYNKVIEIWSAYGKVADEMFGQMHQRDKEGALNPIYVMADSGARGSKQQIRQLSGMRGLMAKPSAKSSRRPSRRTSDEGLTVLEYSSRRTAPARVWPTRRSRQPIQAT